MRRRCSRRRSPIAPPRPCRRRPASRSPATTRGRSSPRFPGVTGNLPAFDQAAAGLGSINWIPDRDQVIRRVPLIYRVGEEFIPTLTTEALRVAQGASTYVLKASNASGETAFGEQTGLNHIKVGDLEIPTDADGGIWLKFRPSSPEAYIPAWKVLAGENDASAVAGRILLVGTSAPGLIDLRATPLEAATPGVEIHAQAIEHILSGASLTRPDYALALELAVTMLLGILVSLVLPRISAASAALLGVATLALILVAGFEAYRGRALILDPSWPALTLFVLIAAATTYIYRNVEVQRAEMRRAFSHYVAPTVVDEIIAHPEKLELGGEVRDLTVLFCDVRNFTAIAEQMNAHELTRFINTLLTPLSDIILKNRGTIDKYMGDAVMAFWNAPLTDPDHAANAARSAVDMIRAMGALNRGWRAEAEAGGRNFKRVVLGIGINSGDCCVGNLGSAQRFDYSAIGDNVNTASRFEGLCKLYGVPTVIGESTVSRMPNPRVLELDLIRVKGKERPARVFTLLDAVSEEGADPGAIESLNAGMLAAYRRSAWAEAEAMIAECRNCGLAPLENFYTLYSTRVTTLREIPPPDDWDGTFTATEK